MAGNSSTPGHKDRPLDTSAAKPAASTTVSPAQAQPPQSGPESVTTATNADETQAAVPPVIPDEETLIRMTRSRLRRRMGGAA
uniref:Uncharacterized protein n=1 Tax=Leersia perrieri TaxID=77586 RepID=A0A0D9VBI1_9ORYZ